MDQSLDAAKLIVLRRVTRAISELLGQQLKGYVATLAPLLHPRHVFGEYVRSRVKQSVKGEAESFERLRQAYLSLAGSGPFNLPKELTSPLDIITTALEFAPATYAYTACGSEGEKAITVTSPLKWVLCFSEFGPQRLRELLANQKTAMSNDLQQCILHFLALDVILQKQRGVGDIFRAVRFPIVNARLEEFGDLPLHYIECPATTVRPPDEVIIQSTEISGTQAFEEVIDLEALAKLSDPLKQQLLEVVRGHGDDLLPSS